MITQIDTREFIKTVLGKEESVGDLSESAGEKNPLGGENTLTNYMPEKRRCLAPKLDSSLVRHFYFSP